MTVLSTLYHVDLSTGDIRTVEFPAAELRKYPGGSALGHYLLWQHCPRGADPLGPENPLIFAVSPLTGLPISGQSRMTVVAKSPVTGGAGDSQCGGFFPAEMAAAGALAIIFTGRSPRPVYLWLKDGRAELRPAEHLWGAVTGPAEAAIRAELNDARVQVAQIGPAGENGVRFAAIMNMANRANGRTGMGAVMGSKNLKAVAVRGTQRVEPARKEAFTALARRFKAQAASTGIAHFGQFGTAGVLASQNHTGGLPTRNYTSGHFEGADAINGERLYETYLKERDTCYACGIRCKRVVEIPGYVDPVYGGPEYETLATFGSYCGVDDLREICKAGEICNQYGMDTISCGATIAWAMECFEKGILTPEQTGGIDLRFGNARAMVRVTELIARLEGIGKLLAEGSARAAAQLGPAAEALTVTVKGSEVPAHMPQTKRSMGLIYAVNPFGADHQSAEHDTALLAKPGSLFRQRLEELGISERAKPKEMGPEKVRFVYWTQLLYSALDTFGLCQFVFGASWQLYGPSDLVTLVQAATDWDTTLWEVMKVGERRLNLMRTFNAREGLDARADQLPAKLFQPLQGGPNDGDCLVPAEMEAARRMYYQMASWDPETGVPLRAKLEELGLGWLAAAADHSGEGSA